jgi:uncharacterized protein YidB (DUF937 family)
MGILDDVTKLAGLSGSGLTGNSALLQGVLQMLGSGTSGGSLTSIVQGFSRAGLGDAASSWVSTGQNVPITTEQLQQGLGTERVRELAQLSGMTEGAAAGALAGLLPTVIDRLTPTGAIPESGQLQQLMASVKGALGSS